LWLHRQSQAHDAVERWQPQQLLAGRVRRTVGRGLCRQPGANDEDHTNPLQALRRHLGNRRYRADRAPIGGVAEQVSEQFSCKHSVPEVMAAMKRLLTIRFVFERLRSKRRKGNIVVLTAILMVVLMGFLALAVDVGYLYTVRDELQRSADAAAIAAAWELIDKDGQTGTETVAGLTTSARSKAVQYAALNKVGNAEP